MENQHEIQLTSDEYVDQEINRMEKAIRTTQVVGTTIAVFLFFWLGGIAVKFQRDLEPKEAANITTGLITDRLYDAQPVLSDYLRETVPAAIERVPELAMQQLPVYRETVESGLEEKLRTLTADTSEALEAVIDQFIVDNQDQFKTVILTGEDEAAIAEIADSLRVAILEYLETPQGNNASIQSQLDAALASLLEIERTTTRLCYAQDLDPREVKTRRAIAALMESLDQKGTQFTGNDNFVSSRITSAMRQAN